MLLTQTLDKLDALGLFGMVLGLRERAARIEPVPELELRRATRFAGRPRAEIRDSRRLALRLKAAKLRQEATVEDLDLRAPRGLDRSVVLSLAQAGWVARCPPQPAHHWTDRCRKIVCGLCVDACRGTPWSHRALCADATIVGGVGAEPWRWPLRAPSRATCQDWSARPR